MYFLKYTNLPLNILQEVYFAKSILLTKMEKCIGRIRNSCSKFKDNYTDKDVIEFNRLMEKQFGMDLFSLQINPDDSIDMYTFDIAERFDIIKANNFKSLVELNEKTGYRFVKNNNLCIIVYTTTGMMCDKNFTDAEILACIIHEIGHNFESAINDNLRIYNTKIMEQYLYYSVFWTLIFNFKNGLNLANFLKTNNNSYQYEKEKNRTRNNIENTGRIIKFEFENLSNNSKEFINRLTNGLLFKLKFMDNDNIIFKYRKVRGNNYQKQTEIIADKFATINGYGPELQSAIAKLSYNSSTNAEKSIENIPLIGAMINVNIAHMTVNNYKIYDHPHFIQRANSSISILKYELEKSNLDPKIRKVIEKQIEQLEDIKNKLDDIDYSKLTDAQYFIYQFGKYVDKKDPYAMTKNVEEKINKLIDEFGK